MFRSLEKNNRLEQWQTYSIKGVDIKPILSSSSDDVRG